MAFKTKRGNGGLRTARPGRTRDVCIIDTASVAGTKRVEGFVELAEGLDAEERLVLKRDRGNAFDEWAVSVHTLAGKRIGVLPLGENEIVARLLDSDRRVYGRVKRLEQRSTWVNLEMRVFLSV